MTDFKKVMSDAGLPVTEDALRQEWQKQIDEHGFNVRNNSPVSPFWRVVQAIVTKPVLWLFEFVATTVLPNLFIATAKDVWLERLGQSRNVYKKEGVAAIGRIVFNRDDNTGTLTIPANTIIQTDQLNGQILQMALTYPINFDDGESSIEGVCEALNVGNEFNLPAGYFVNLAQDIEGVTVTNNDDWLITPGANDEEDDDYRLRIIDRFATLGDYHVDAVYRSIISQFPGMRSANIEFEHNAPRGPGTANAFVFLEIGSVPTALLNQINDHISGGFHGHGDDLIVYAMPTQGFDIVVDIYYHANAIDVTDKIEAFIRAAFRENRVYEPTRVRPVSTFAFSVLDKEIHEQFSELSRIEYNLNHIEIGRWLPVLNSLTVVSHA